MKRVKHIPFLEWVDELSRSLRGLRSVAVLVVICLIWMLIFAASVVVTSIWSIWSSAAWSYTLDMYRVVVDGCVNLFGLFVAVQTGADVKNAVMYRQHMRNGENDDTPEAQ